MISGFNQGFIDEINSLRTNPQRYANKLYKYTNYFKGNVLRLPGASSGIKTEEGPAPYTEAGDFLGKQDKLEVLEPSRGLCGIAEDLLKQIQDLDPSDVINVDMEKIIGNHGYFNGNFSRAIDYGGETPEQVLINLIVCDGDSSRGQRGSLLSTDFKRIGIANGYHSMYKRCCVVVYCTEFYNTKEKDDKIYVAQSRNTNDEEEEEENNEKEEEYQGEVLRPRKVIIGRRPDDDEDEEPKEKDKDNLNGLPKGCISISKSSKIVVEGGKKKRITKITKTLENGTKEVETIKEAIDED